MEAYPFRFLRNLGRTREIATVLFNHGFGDLVEQLRLRQYLQWGQRVLLRRKLEPKPGLTRAMRIRMSLESLGPTFIKFGQVASTRPDLIPPDVIDELSKLQEGVPPFASERAVAVVEAELEGSIERLFSQFERKPMAAGSLAQVHRAWLHDGTEVAVKIRRPNVVRDVERDLSLMYEIAALAERHIPEAEIFAPVDLVNQFARTIRRELSFTREGRTIDEFAKLFRYDATLSVPKVYWDRTSDAVLTMDFVDGYSVTDKAGLAELGISRSSIAANGARIFMKQAFEFGLFHGDPHPGNIRVLHDGSLCLLDFGMVGVLEDEKREQLVDLFLSISKHDVKGAVDVVLKLGEPRRPVEAPVLRADIRDFVDSYYGLPLERINIGRMLSDFVSILSEHHIRCPSDLMLLIRALVTLEGVGRDLDSRFNLAEELSPFIEHVVRERYNPRQIMSRLTDEARTFLQLAHDLPLQIGDTIEKLSKDDLKIQLEHRGLDRLMNELDRSSNRLVISMVMSALILASALIIRTREDAHWYSVPAFILSSLLGMWLIYGVFRSGRL